MLARNAKLYTHKRLKAAAEERGHTLDIINTLRCYMNIASHRPEVGTVKQNELETGRVVS